MIRLEEDVLLLECKRDRQRDQAERRQDDITQRLRRLEGTASDGPDRGLQSVRRGLEAVRREPGELRREVQRLRDERKK
jgi:hypothetical protein